MLTDALMNNPMQKPLYFCTASCVKIELKGLRHTVLRAYAVLLETWDKKGG